MTNHFINSGRGRYAFCLELKDITSHVILQFKKGTKQVRPFEMMTNHPITNGRGMYTLCLEIRDIVHTLT